MFIESFSLFVLFPSCTVATNVDAGIQFVFFPPHVVVMNVDTGICFLLLSCSGHECGCRNMSFFSFHVVVMNVDAGICCFPFM